MTFNYQSEIHRYRRYYQTIEGVLLKPKTHAYTSAIFSFLAVSLFGWYAIRPTIQTIIFLQKEIADDKIVNQKMEEKITTLVQAQATFQSIQSKLPLLNQALPEDPDALGVVSSLRNLSQTVHASVSAISVSPVSLGPENRKTNQEDKSPEQSNKTPQAPGHLEKKQSNKVVDVPILMALSGTFSSIETFLNELITMRRILTIDSINLKPDRESATSSSSDPILRLNLKLTIHYLPM